MHPTDIHANIQRRLAEMPQQDCNRKPKSFPLAAVMLALVIAIIIEAVRG